MRVVQKIPATIRNFKAKPLDTQQKRRVAGYARVSTDHDDQITSYEAQVDYYTRYIKGRDDWEFVGIYDDEGISGTSLEHRKGMQQLIEDCKAEKIDLVLTKSIARFA